MTQWKLTLTFNSKHLGDSDVKRDVFQGISLSALFYVIISILLFVILR